jgi:hypothetical protein
MSRLKELKDQIHEMNISMREILLEDAKNYHNFINKKNDNLQNELLKTQPRRSKLSFRNSL